MAVGCNVSQRSVAISAYRARKRNLPRLPQDINDFVIENEWAETLDGQDFLLFDDRLENGRIVCFCAQADLRMMCRIDELYLDGTFSCAPRLFSQLYTIHGFFEEKQLPLCYVLLTGKTTEMYEHLFRRLKEHAAQLQLVLNPTRIVSDFEIGVKRAVAIQFPQAEHKGCFFHFCQAVYRKVQELGLQGQYNNPEQPETRNFVRKLMASGFLPQAEVIPAVQALAGEAPDVPRMNEFINYFQDTWIGGRFPIRMWNVHQQRRRTNNDVEGWHNAFNRLVRKFHPNIWELIVALRKEQANAAATQLQIFAGHIIGVRQVRYVRLNERLQTFTQQYIDGVILRDRFLSCVAYALAAPL
ncbi:uncharacterized protein [Diadema setosum]|uniref:uncharacterized protein n=1 Tax=Diadema setosum TaxID=31175 RepID=UPI003B3A4A03